MYTTLNKVRRIGLRKPIWKVLKSLHKPKGGNSPLSMAFILDTLTLNDTLLCLRSVEGHDSELRHFAVFCARQVLHLMKDKRSVDAIDVAEKFAKGEATQDELKTAYDAAHAVAAEYTATPGYLADYAAVTAYSVAYPDIRDVVTSVTQAAVAASYAVATKQDTADNDAAEMYKEQKAELRRIFSA